MRNTGASRCAGPGHSRAEPEEVSALRASVPLRVETIGHATLYLGDCRDLLPSISSDGTVDAIVTDPPYGIGKRLTSGGKSTSGEFSGMTAARHEWDVRPERELFDLLFGMSTHQIIWGGNFFGLPPCEKPLCWDKIRPNQKNVSEWEYAWTSLSGRAQMIQHCANGGFVMDAPREHPTQKPLPVMKWCIGFLPDANTILDPFMGTGTTGVAAVQLGRNFIGIERDAEYFEIACRRIREANGDDVGPLFGEAA